MRLDEEKLEALRSWGERLGASSSAEHAAIGRAILMLVAEIDRLHVDLWHARMAASENEPSENVNAVEEEPVATRLHTRLQQLLRRTEPVEPVEPSGSDLEGDAKTSAQAWLEDLRRQN
jgi:hypothetical protein